MKTVYRTPSHLETLRTELSKLVSFSDSSWSAAEQLFAVRAYAAGENVIEAGERVREINFVVTGLARYFYLTSDGKEFNKSFARTGQVLSSVSSLVSGAPSPFSIQALEPCECLTISYEDLEELCNGHREWEILARRLLEQLAIKKERREADFLLLSASERYTKFLDEFADVADRIPNYHIASYLGITEVGLSRIRKRLGFIPVNPG